MPAALQRAQINHRLQSRTRIYLIDWATQKFTRIKKKTLLKDLELDLHLNELRERLTNP